MHNLNKIISLDSLLNRISDKHPELHIPYNCLFLGAGSSIEANIPKASNIIEICKKKAFVNYSPKGLEVKVKNKNIDEFIKENKNEFTNFVSNKEKILKDRIRIDIQKLLKKSTPLDIDYLKNLSVNQQIDIFFDEFIYGHWFEVFSEDRKQRQREIEGLVDQGETSGAYILLSYLIRGNLFRNLFTTNFDDLVNDSLLQYAETKARVFSHNETVKDLNFHTEKPNIIKLHGDFLFDNIKNIPSETESLEANMHNKLEEALKNLNLIVLGYRGADSSIMKSLEKIKEQSNFGLFWCGRNFDKLHWRAKNLILNTPNSYFIQVDSFETFIAKAWIKYEDSIIKTDLEEVSERRKLQLKKFLETYIHNVNAKESLSNLEKEKIKISIKNVIEHKGYEELYNLKNNFEKIEYLKKVSFEKIGLSLRDIGVFKRDMSQANELLSFLDIDDFFSEKIKKSQIQHIGSGFSNLKVINSIKAKIILDSIDDEILINKLKTAHPDKVYSALGELKSVSKNKVDSISKKLPIEELAKFKKFDLKELKAIVSDMNNVAALKVLNSYPNNLLLEIFLKGKLVEIAAVLDKIKAISSSKALFVLLNIEIQDFIDKFTESSLSQIGNSLKHFYDISKTKTKKILLAIPINLLRQKFIKSDITEICRFLSEIAGIEKTYTVSFLKKIDMEFLVERFRKKSFSEISNGITMVNKIDSTKALVIIEKVGNEELIKKLNNEAIDFDGIGAALLNFKNFQIDRIKEILSKSNLILNSKKLAEDASFSSSRSFITYITTILDLNFDIGCKVLQDIDKDYLTNLYNWMELDKYTNTLPIMLKAFDRILEIRQAKMLSGFLCMNIDILKKRLREAEFGLLKSLINKYEPCKG
jgi:hypothetical protein